ncbi:MAG: NADH-ubiquinone oxidoreductase chain G [uncultured Chloroflexi bacterium]|uniref:NADH-quinone oxidoreductase n=1 Tax=uncultured Chloroflexota bacterium TaxID=166587 RepID=A0A6J4JXI4_9CHLR|nr:MAG: NADH-ubiquinone oxidoreductase chain G [uncultured Chloroflexota bacterium]
MTAAPRSNTVTLTIDGAEITVPAGTLVVEAARQVGSEVPVFCYHPKLSLAGACRMCQCSIAMAPPPGQPARPPALMTACTTRVSPGMVVDTMSAPAIKARESVIEFLLINHPLDCPVCDAGGECPLQDNSHAWGPKESRFAEDKRLARKGASLSPLVVLDQERCIVCYRCTRFMAEVPGQAELDFHQRGYRSQLRVIEDRPMQSRFQGNIIDLCPCGALTSETYRFRSRPHDLDHADSVCAQCPVGCNLILDSRANEVARVRPRQNEAVNEIWLCDKGRFGQHYASSPDRLRAPIVRQDDGTARMASWPEAIGSAAVALQRVKQQHGPQAIGVIGGRNLTNEDCYALARFASEVLETPNVDHRIGARNRAANPLAAYGLDSFNSEYIDAEHADAIFLIGADVYEEMPVFWLRIRKGITKGAKLLVANPRSTEADRLAFRRLRYLPGQELAVLRAIAAALVEKPPMVEQPAPPPPAEGQEPQPAPPPVPRDLSGLAAALGGLTAEAAAQAANLNIDAVRAAAAALAVAKRPLIYVGSRLTLRSDVDQLAAALVGLAGALGSPKAINFFPEGANARGAEYAGLVPGQGGLSAGEIIAAAAEGTVKALYLVGENVLETHPDRQQAERALANAEVVVVHELFETATTQHAHVVFAATAVPEKDGTMTNAEGRLQRLYRGVIPAEQALADWRILADLSSEMGVALGYAAAVEITRDMLADLPVYAPAAENIPAEGIICRTFGSDAGARAPGATRRRGTVRRPPPAHLLRARRRRDDGASHRGTAGHRACAIRRGERGRRRAFWTGCRAARHAQYRARLRRAQRARQPALS